MTAEVVPFPRRHDPCLTYMQLSRELGVSVRWLRYRKAEGMPDCGLDWKGQRVFRLSDVQMWLEAWGKRYGRSWRSTPGRET